MPFKPRRKTMPRKPRRMRKTRSKYRGTIARIPRAIPMKPKSVCQKLVYYNSFHCVPGLDLNNQQQNWYFTIALNSPWPFIDGWDTHAQNNNRVLAANSPIYPLTPSHQPDIQTTAMPGLKDGYDLFHQYQNGLVVGTKVILSAQPTLQGSAGEVQSGVLYAIRHAKADFGLQDTSTIVDVQKLPFRQMKRIAGPSDNTGFFERNTGAKLVVAHSPKKFNNVQSLKDNERFQFHQATSAHPYGITPDDSDFLTVGVVPSLVNYQSPAGVQARKCTDFKLSMRIEQTILFTEPLENLGEGTGNYSLPWRAGREFLRQTFLQS